MPTRTTTSLPCKQLTVADGNWDSNRAKIDRVVLHTMVGTVKSANARFNNPSSQVSSHYGVDMNGDLYQWVDEDNVAYTNGNYAMNQRSVTIEHADNGDYDGTRPDSLYQTAGNLVRDICQFYGIPIDRAHILKHREIVATHCPGTLDVDRIIRIAKGEEKPQEEQVTDIKAKELIYFATHGNWAPEGSEREFINSDISPEEYAKVRFKDEVVASNYRTATGNYAPQFERDWWLDHQANGGGHPVEDLAVNWHQNLVLPQLEAVKQPLVAEIEELKAKLAVSTSDDLQDDQTIAELTQKLEDAEKRLAEISHKQPYLEPQMSPLQEALQLLRRLLELGKKSKTEDKE